MLGRSPESVLESGGFRYAVDTAWAKPPAGMTIGDVAAVGIDSKDRVFVFNRGEHPMMVFDRDGNLLNSWGEGMFPRAHGLQVGPDDTLWLTDDGNHTVRHCTADGKVLMTIGVPGKPSPYLSGVPFNRCTHTALAPNGDIYVSDGYGNARVHKYSPDGKLLTSWGASGIAPGEFNVPHNICCDADGYVYVCDRENHRIQVFDGDGRFETQWHSLHRPCAMCMAQGLFFVAEIGPELAINKDATNLGPRISILDSKGKVLARLGDVRRGSEPTQFVAPHGIAVDRYGDIYIGELPGLTWPRFFDQPPPHPLSPIRKLRKL